MKLSLALFGMIKPFDFRPKTPEWAEKETGGVARAVLTIAREWELKRTYVGTGSIGNGFGGACRTSAQWERMLAGMLASFRTAIAVVREWRRRARSRRELASYSYNERSDLGCFAADLDAEIAKPFWQK